MASLRLATWRTRKGYCPVAPKITAEQQAQRDLARQAATEHYHFASSFEAIQSHWRAVCRCLEAEEGLRMVEDLTILAAIERASRAQKILKSRHWVED